jgi:hypothetical protein
LAATLPQNLRAPAARQFATVTVSAVGAEVDRMEHEMARLVPGTRYVDLETDRGKPARPPSPGALLAAQQRAAAAVGAGGRVVTDPGAESDHLADLVYYPLGSLTSVDSFDDGTDWVLKLDAQQQQQLRTRAGAGRHAAAAGEPAGGSSGGGADAGGGSGEREGGGGSGGSTSDAGSGAAVLK